MYWNDYQTIETVIQSSWIVTLDVLKLERAAQLKAEKESWIVTLDVLKLIKL